MLVNVAHTLSASRVSGPGLRAVIWVQGCGLRCPGCHNRSMWPHVAQRILSVEVLAHWALGQAGRGLTLTGGEPFEQALALAALAKSVRAAGRDVVAYSGYTHEQLQEGVRPFSRELLAEVDLLIDGPYVEAQRGREPLRGSQNQRLHFLTGRIVAGEVRDLPRLEITLGEGAACATGLALDALAAWSED